VSRPQLSAAQRAAAYTTGRDLLVSAGAGTGKTLVLVERVLDRLRRGEVALADMLIVTFTEKAAREMAERIYEEIARDPRLRGELVQFPRASISTLHSFCARLLRQTFLEAAIEPGFRILGEDARTEALQTAMRQAFHEWYRDEDAARARRFRSLVERSGFDRGGEILRHVIGRLHDYARVTPDPAAYLDGLLERLPASRVNDLPWHRAMVDQLELAWSAGVELYDSALALAEAESLPTARHRELFDHLGRFPGPGGLADEDRQRELVSRLTDAGWGCLETNSPADPEQSFRIKFPSAPRGANKLPGFHGLHEQAKRFFERPPVRSLPWNEIRLLGEDREQLESLGVLVGLVRRTDELYSQFKQRGGWLDFSDLEIHTARLLRTHGASLGLDHRFREVLVDEFQDINPLQDEILRGLCPPSGCFRVGDVKQSIYQFRQADPTIFLSLARGRQLLRREEDGGGDDSPAIVFLKENHRSRPAILRLTNALFSFIFDENELGSPYEEQALEPRRDEEDGVTPVELLVIELARPSEQEPESPPTAAGRAATEPEAGARRTPTELQAALAAQRIAELIRREGVTIPQRGAGPADGLGRPASWSDVAILLRSAARARDYEEALTAQGIPCVLDQGAPLLEEEGVRDLRCLLQLVDNPRDDVALAAVLRSPLVGIPDADLLRLRLTWPESATLLDAAVATAYEGDPGAGIEFFIPPDDSADSAEDVRADWSGPRGEPAEELASEELRRRLRHFFERLRRWRETAPELPLTRFIDLLVEESRLPMILTARGTGEDGRAAFRKFLSMASDYEKERGSSLHGFLHRLLVLETHGSKEGVPGVTENADAVRILTVHKSKGLEFPIVVLPQLEWPFQREQLGNMIRIGRRWVGLREFDPRTWTRRDTAPRWTLELSQERAAWMEEARVFYVAVTRARERLIMIGACRQAPWDSPALPRQAGRRLLETRRNVLAWVAQVLPWQEKVPAGGESGAEGRDYVLPSIPMRVRWLADLEIGLDRRTAAARTLPPAIAEAIRSGAPLPVVAPPGPIDHLAGTWRPSAGASPEADHPAETVETLASRLAAPSPFAPLASLEALKGKYWVTELKQVADLDLPATLEEEAGSRFLPVDPLSHEPPGHIMPSRYAPGDDAPPHRMPNQDAPGHHELAERSPLARQEAMLRGVRYHTAISRLDLLRHTAPELEAQWLSFSRQPWWDGAPRDAHFERGIQAFLHSPLGVRLRRAAQQGALEREALFSLKVPVEQLPEYLPALRSELQQDARWQSGPWTAELNREWALLQGRIDCIFREDDRHVVLDWKTDRVTSKDAVARARDYLPQMLLYTEAGRRLWGGPVEAFLVFLWSGAVLRIEAEAPKGS